MNGWALVPVAILGTGLAGLCALATIAGGDPSFALETDYYEKAVHWERRQAEWAENARLGWRLELSAPSAGAPLTARLLTADGAPLARATVSAEAFANARAGEVRRLSFEEAAPGTYSAAAPKDRPGLWEFRFSVRHGGDHFTQIVRTDLQPELGRR